MCRNHKRIKILVCRPSRCSKKGLNLEFTYSFRFKGAVRWYTVDLDLTPSKRWTEIITEKKNDVSWPCSYGNADSPWHIFICVCVCVLFQLISMIQAIRDLADAFVPSGRLEELIDTAFVSVWGKEGGACSRLIIRWQVCMMFVFQPLMVDTLPYPFNEEIKGIATASGVPLGKNIHRAASVISWAEAIRL